MLYKLLLFLILNFMGLALGAKFTGSGVSSDWYQNLNKAPWTPPGWVFGAAWTTIMLCFSVYLAYLWKASENKILFVVLFTSALLLNIAWNPLFFHYRETLLALLVISLLTLLIGFYFIYYLKTLQYYTILILPYLIWMLIATSLNAYIYLNN
ncbi:MAG: TspO/MBR family protein [Cytophagales bacterium]